MKIELSFDLLPEGLGPARLAIHLEDAGEADAPAERLCSWRFEPVVLEVSGPALTFDLGPLPRRAGKADDELSLFVRVDAEARGQAVRFINTTTVPVPQDGTPSLVVPLERVV